MLRRQLPHAGRAAGRPRRAGRRQRRRRRPAGGASPTRRWTRCVAYGERRMRAALAALPDGHVAVRGRPRLDRSAPTQQRRAGRGAGARSIGEHGRRSTSPAPAADGRQRQRRRGRDRERGRLRAALGDRPDDPGQRRRACDRCAVVAPPGSIVAATFPAAVGAGNVEVSQRVADVCLGALAQAVPDRVGAASQGTMNNVLIGGPAAGCTTRPSAAGRAAARPRRHERRPHRR